MISFHTRENHHLPLTLGLYAATKYFLAFEMKLFRADLGVEIMICTYIQIHG